MKSLYQLRPAQEFMFTQVAESIKAGIVEATSRMTNEQIKQLVTNPYDELSAEQSLRQAA